MSYISVDVEADGQIPHKYSMVCFGAIVVEPSLSKTFYGKTKPTSDLWIPSSLAVSGFTREEHLKFDDPLNVMYEFDDWVKKNTIGSPVFISDNPAFDWSFINYYFHFFVGKNPFGWSARRLGDIYCGLEKNMRVGKDWKKFRKTKHTHHPVEDATGVAEALLEMQKLGLKF